MDFPEDILFPQKTIYKRGAASRLADESLEFGARGLVVHGKSLEDGGKKENILSRFCSDAKVEGFCKKSGETDLDDISCVIQKAKDINAEWIAGIGGGSVLDLAKAAAGLFNSEEAPVFYQEGGALENKGIPFIAVPTTAGTGSEATPNSVVINKEKKAKLSIRDESFMARKVILDAELLEGMPSSVMSYAAMDAFVQAYESFSSTHATWFSENLALKAIDLINRNIMPAQNVGGEENLACLLLGSYFAGMAFASSRLGVIHGIAHPLGALYGLPHGLICSACLLPSVKLNRDAMGPKYEMMSGILGSDLIEKIEFLLAGLRITSPFKGKKMIEKEKIIEAALSSGSTAANPKKIKRCDIEFILAEIF